MKIRLLLFSLALFVHNCVFTQVQQEWVQRYNGTANNNDEAISITIDKLGNVYVTGWSVRTGTNRDYVTIKYNSAGITRWVQSYNYSGLNDDYANSIAVDVNGNVYVTGFSESDTTGYDYATIKYDSNGVLLWVKRYSGPGNFTEEPKSLILDNSGNVYVTGYSYIDAINSDYATIKYNTNGSQEWVKRYNGSANSSDVAYSIALDNNGGVYVTGYSNENNTGDDLTTIKYNSSGVQQWIQKYNDSAKSVDRGYSIAADISNDVIVTGYTELNGGFSDYLTIKYNNAGIQQWSKKYNGPVNGEDGANAVTTDNQRNIYVTGYSNGTYFDYATIKYNASGIQQWVQRYNGPGNGHDWANSISVDRAGNVYITGFSEGSNTAGDYATIRYTSSGNLSWIQRYNGPNSGNDQSLSICTDTIGNVYITGFSEDIVTNDYATIKYSQPIGITPISNQIPSQFILEQNYPNPFNPKTIINFQLPVKGFVRISVYDMLGREVETLVNQDLNAGAYKTDWDAAKYSSGIYYYRIISGGYSDTKKMILVK